MRRLSIDVIIDEEDTYQSIADNLDLTLDELMSFNPYLRNLHYLRDNTIVHLRLIRVIPWEGKIRLSMYKSDAEIL